LALGLPFELVDFVVRDKPESLRAADLLRQQVSLYREFPIGARSTIRHDVFLSYAHHDATEAEWIARTLQNISPGLRVFRDVTSLRVGGI